VGVLVGDGVGDGLPSLSVLDSEVTAVLNQGNKHLKNFQIE
jgi:hypothetical protein